jgi:hypothetical protein
VASASCLRGRGRRPGGPASARERKEGDCKTDDSRKTAAAKHFTSAAVAQGDDVVAAWLAGKEKGAGGADECEGGQLQGFRLGFIEQGGREVAMAEVMAINGHGVLSA